MIVQTYVIELNPVVYGYRRKIKCENLCTKSHILAELLSRKGRRRDPNKSLQNNKCYVDYPNLLKPLLLGF